MVQQDFFRSPARPWNRGRISGAKPPFKPKHVWAIRQQLKTAGRIRDLALFDCPSVPMSMRQRSPGSLPLRVQVKHRNGHAPNDRQRPFCRCWS